MTMKSGLQVKTGSLHGGAKHLQHVVRSTKGPFGWETLLACGHRVQTEFKPPSSYYCAPCAKRASRKLVKFRASLPLWRARATRHLDLSCLESHAHSFDCYIAKTEQDHVWRMLLRLIDMVGE